MQAFIGQIEPSSDKVWKGKNSFVLHFAGCNFNCPYCNAPHLLSSKEEYAIDLKEVKKQISENSHQVDCVFFTGGEPCLQRAAVIELAKYSRQCGLRVGVATNGSKPDCLRLLIQGGLLDYIAFDIKCPQEEDIFRRLTKSETFFITIPEIMYDVQRSLELLKENENLLQIEFRTTIVPGLMFKKEDLLKVAKEIVGIESRWVLQPFMPENTKKGSFSQLNPPSQNFLETLRKYLLKGYPNMRIEKG